MKTLLLSLFSAITLLASAQPYAVGHVSVNFKDATRTGGYAISGGTTFPTGGTGRDIGAEIYYPATSTGNNTAFASGRFPVIVFGHGFAMGYDAYTTFFDSMARSGYIIALPRTEGSLLPAPSHLDFGKDLAKVAELLLVADATSSSFFYNKLTGREAIGGHSMGGGATFLSDAYANPNVLCYFTFAAAETNPSAVAAAKLITRPHLIFSGTYDCVAPPAAHQTLMYDSLTSTCKAQINITKAYHCAFADNNFNCGFGEGTCITSGGLSSTNQQQIVRMYLEPYLDYYLKGVCASWYRFQGLVDTATIATISQSCNNSVPQSAVITGNDFYCTGDSALLTATDAGFTYTWSNAANTANIYAQAGSYSVTVSNSICQLVSQPFTVTEKLLPANPSAISAADTVCSGISNIAISVSADTTVMYNWNLPQGWSINNGDSTAAITAISGSNGGTVSISAFNQCGVSDTINTYIEVVPSNLGTPGSIAGDTVLCAGETTAYSITPVAGAVTYVWTLPNGWSANSNTDSVWLQVNALNNSGQVTVAAVNGCGQSIPAVVNVTIAVVDTPLITANTDTLLCNVTGSSYQWYYNGQPIGAASTQTYVATQAGNYSVEVFNAEGCSNVSNTYNYTISGLNDLTAQLISVYPNPANNYVTINYAGPQPAKLNLLATDGRIILSQTITNGQNRLALGSIAKGVYIVAIEGKKGLQRTKLIVE